VIAANSRLPRQPDSKLSSFSLVAATAMLQPSVRRLLSVSHRETFGSLYFSSDFCAVLVDLGPIQAGLEVVLRQLVPLLSLDL
jgi:hypothetical protein